MSSNIIVFDLKSVVMCFSRLLSYQYGGGLPVHMISEVLIGSGGEQAFGKNIRIVKDHEGSLHPCGS